MGNTFLRYLHPVEREVRDLRKDLIDRFQKQQFLILGPPGCGKSSLVNSFNYVINLTNPEAQYKEVAQVGAVIGAAKTRKLTKYDFNSDDGMYYKLSPDQRRDAPAFIDLMGLPNKADFSDFISKLANGKIKDGTDMMKALSEEDSSYRENLGREHREPQKHMAAWAIIFVLSIRETFPDRLLHDVREAIEMVDDETRSRDLRIFAFITKVDTYSEERKNQKMADITEKFQKIMSVPRHRIMPIMNYTDKDYCPDTRKYRPDRDKQRLILKAFEEIYNTLPDPFEKKLVQ